MTWHPSSNPAQVEAFSNFSFGFVKFESLRVVFPAVCCEADHGTLILITPLLVVGTVYFENYGKRERKSPHLMEGGFPSEKI